MTTLYQKPEILLIGDIIQFRFINEEWDRNSYLVESNYKIIKLIHYFYLYFMQVLYIFYIIFLFHIIFLSILSLFVRLISISLLCFLFVIFFCLHSFLCGIWYLVFFVFCSLSRIKSFKFRFSTSQSPTLKSLMHNGICTNTFNIAF